MELEKLVDDLKKAKEDGVKYIVITNGVEWQIFSTSFPIYLEREWYPRFIPNVSFELSPEWKAEYDSERYWELKYASYSLALLSQKFQREILPKIPQLENFFVALFSLVEIGKHLMSIWWDSYFHSYTIAPVPLKILKYIIIGNNKIANDELEELLQLTTHIPKLSKFLMSKKDLLQKLRR